MSQIRKAHSLEIIDRRLRDAEANGDADAMELIGLHDELSRVERKWLENKGKLNSGNPRQRPLANTNQMNTRFDRLLRLVEAALRKPQGNSQEHALLLATAESLRIRTPLKS